MLKRVMPYAAVVVVTMLLTTIFQPLSDLRIAAQQGTAQQGNCQTFPQTGKTICGKFLAYWQSHGGLAQQGYPISAEFTEASDLDPGKSYTVQYFQRAVFELHPEYAGTPYEVLLAQLGTYRLQQKYPNGVPGGGAPPPAPAPVPAASPTAPAPNPTAPPAPPPSGGIVGQTINFKGTGNQGSFKGTVAEVRETRTINGAGGPVTANGKFVVVFMNVTNLGAAPTEVGLTNFHLRDSAGRGTYPAALSVQQAARNQYGVPGPYYAIQPGATTTLIFVFDVAPDATGYLMVEEAP